MRARIAELARRNGLELVGVADAGPLPEAQARMEESVAAGRMGLMGWMGGSRPARAANPRTHDPSARSVVVVAAPYVGAGRGAWDAEPRALHEALAPILEAAPATPTGRIARYALGTDYHVALRGRLESLAADLRDGGCPPGRWRTSTIDRWRNGRSRLAAAWAGSARTRTSSPMPLRDRGCSSAPF
jgi:epoxyqueuosine reductase QueG